MTRTQQEKQQDFREKLQTEGADGFADGPRPWENWDESGNQEDNHIWEGTARRVYPKQPAKRGPGERLLSGLAVVAFTGLLVGVAGVYFSSPPVSLQANSAIQPAPIIASRRAAPRETLTIASRETTATPENLDSLQATAAGTPVATAQPVQPPQLPPAASVASPAQTTTAETLNGNIDKIAIETIITEEMVTTTVYTRQPTQDTDEVVAIIATTPPPFTHQTILVEAPATTTANDNEIAVADEKPPIIPLTRLDNLAAPAAGGTADAADNFTEHTAQAVPVPAPSIIEQADDSATASPVTPPAAEPPPEVTDVALNTTEAAVAAAPEISHELEAATDIPVAPPARTGIWVINLSSYTRKTTAERMLGVFEKKGVDAEVYTTTINDKPMHRIRVPGFASARSAKAEISSLEQRLGLEGAWVSRR